MSQQTKLKFYHDNILANTTVPLVATSTSTGVFAIDNISNGLETNRWKGTSTATQVIEFDAGAGNTVDASYIAIFGHNLFAAGATAVVQHSTSGAWGGEHSNSFNGPIDTSGVYLAEFATAGEFRYWRVLIQGQSTIPYISIMNLGTVTTLDWIQPPFDPYAQQRMTNANITQGGFVSGIHTKHTERQLSISLANSNTAVYASVLDWNETNGAKNFFMAWNSTGDATAIYLVRPDDSFNNPLTVDKLRNITINLKGRKA